MSKKRTFLLGTVTNYGSIAVSTLVGFISVPIGLHYLGSVQYGIWLVIAAIVSYMRMADLGIGLATLVLISHESKAVNQGRILSRSIKILLFSSTCFIVITLGLTYVFPHWAFGILGKIPSNLAEQAKTAALAAILLVFLQLPTTIFSAAFSGLQKIHWERIYGACYSLASLIALIVTIYVKGNLITLSMVTGISGLIIGILSGIHLLLAHPNLRSTGNKTEEFIIPPGRIFFFSGLRFFVLQIASVMIWNTGSIVINHYLGSGQVTPYGVTLKLFMTGILLTNAIGSVLYPMYAKAAGQGDWSWINQVYNRYASTIVILGGLIWIGGINFGELIIKAWAGPVAYGGLLTVFALGGYAYMCSYGGANAGVINGLNPTNIIPVVGMIEAFLNLILSVTLIIPFGIGGVALGTFIASLQVSWFAPLYIRHRTRQKVSLNLSPILKHAIFIVFPAIVFSLLAVLYFPAAGIRVAAGFGIIICYMIFSWIFIIPADFKKRSMI